MRKQEPEHNGISIKTPTKKWLATVFFFSHRKHDTERLA